MTEIFSTSVAGTSETELIEELHFSSLLLSGTRPTIFRQEAEFKDIQMKDKSMNCQNRCGWIEPKGMMFFLR